MKNSLHPFISIIIPTRNTEKVIKKCLKRLQLLHYPKNRLEIIISNGLSDDNTRKISAKAGAIVLNNERRDYSSGRNLALKHAKGDLIAFIDADCIVDKEWLIAALKYFKAEEVGGIGGPTLPPTDQNNFQNAVSLVYDFVSPIIGTVHSSKQKKTKEVTDLPTCNSIFRRCAILQVSPFDETLIAEEDVDISNRIMQLGYKLLRVPDVRVRHYRRKDIKGLWIQTYRYARGRLQVGRKNRKLTRFGHILVGFTLPLVIIGGSFLLIMMPALFKVILSIFIIGILFSFFFSLIQTKSLKISVNVPIVIITMTFAWSFGFMRELLFPFKKAFWK